MAFSIASRLSAGSFAERGEDAGQPVVGVGADGREVVAELRRTRRRSTATTARPNMIGSHTFIIVALRCTENSTPRSLASAICSARNASSAARRITAASTISPSRTGSDGLEHGDRAVGGDVLDAQGGRPRSAVTEVSEWRKSPSLIVATCEADSGDHAPIECGWLRANCFTEAGARRSELPSRSTGLTALPLHRVVRRARRLLLVGLRVLRVVGHRVARRLQLLDRRLELRDRRADVRQLDDVGLGRGGQLAELGRARRAPGRTRRRMRPDERDVAGLDADTGRARRTPRSRAGASASPAPVPRRCRCR